MTLIMPKPLSDRGSTQGQSRQRNAGFGIIELIVAVAILGLATEALFGINYLALNINNHLKKNLIASYMAQETIEAAIAVKNESWNSLAALTSGAPYHPIKSGAPLKWSFGGEAENTDGFQRQIIVNNVYRDANDDIINSGGALDPGTKKITARVSWTEQNKNYQVELISYLTNWKP